MARVPAWRTLEQGTTGADVSQLNHDLVGARRCPAAQLSAAGWDYFSSATQAAVEKLQSALGISSPPGSLSQGSVGVRAGRAPGRHCAGSLGGPASGPVLTATSDPACGDDRADPSEQGEVKPGTR